MRAQILSITVLAVLAAACSSDSNSGTGPTTPTTPGTNAATVSVDSGFADRTATVSSTIPAHVHVTQNGQPAAGVTVTWTVSTGGGTLASPTSVSDATGLAVNSWTLNDTVRTSTLTAGIPGVSSATLQVTTIGGPPTALAKVSPDSIGIVAGATTLVTIRVTDKTGNPASGVSVSWTNSGGGALTTATTVTGISGNGQAVFSTEPTPKSYTVTATVAGIGALTFKVVGL